MALEASAAHVQGEYFEALAETVHLNVYLLPRLRTRLDEAISLFRGRWPIWPIRPYDPALPLVPESGLGAAPPREPCRLQLEFFLSGFGATVLRLCFSWPPDPEDIATLREVLQEQALLIARGG